jgi:1-acyl-sn-glycerol-3-phosphate acyltransferase
VARRRLIDLPILAVPLSLFFWIACVLIVIFWTPAVAILRLATFRSDRNRTRVGRLLRDSAAFAVRINPFWDFRVHDEVHPDASTPYLFVANHKSLADVFLLTLLPWEMKFLSKDSIFRIPLLGWQMRVAGDIEVTRGDRDSSRQAIDQMRDRLVGKSSVIVFPEGTRSADGSLAPFREGAFRLAIELGVAIVPLAVRGTEQALPKHSIVLRRTEASATVLPPVATKGLGPEDAAALAEDVRGRIGKELSAPARS